MRLLIAVPSKASAEFISKNTMRWLPRTGYEVRVFVEPRDVDAYREAFQVAQYEYRTHIPKKTLVDVGFNDRGPEFVTDYINRYAVAHAFDLVLVMGDDVKRFRGAGDAKSDDAMVMDFCQMIGECRKLMSEAPYVAAFAFVGYKRFPMSAEDGELLCESPFRPRNHGAYLVRQPFLTASVPDELKVLHGDPLGIECEVRT